VRLIQEIGSYAGIAAIPGLAILSALYFSQARDVRRLRDWAGRAPERTAEQAQGGRVMPRPATPAAAQPAAQPAAARPAAATGAATAAASSTGAATATATRPSPPGTHPPVPRVPAAGQTSVLGPAASPASNNGGDPWYRRAASRLPAARYIAILLVGIAVVGGGIAYGVTQLGNDSSPGTQQPSKSGDIGGGSKKKDRNTPAPIKAGDVKVAVLNGTTVNFLARKYGDRLQQQGFNVGNEANSNQGQVNESVVLFKPGKSREANLVRRKLNINSIEPADQTTLTQGGDADVIVVIGADLAQQTTP
jgi:hypothetical protein